MLYFPWSWAPVEASGYPVVDGRQLGFGTDSAHGAAMRVPLQASAISLWRVQPRWSIRAIGRRRAALLSAASKSRLGEALQAEATVPWKWQMGMALADWTPSLQRLGPCLRADDPQGARLEVLLVALADDWLSKDLPALWRGGRCRAWPGPAAGGGSDRVSDWVLVTVVQLDRPPQQFPQDLNGSKGSDPHSKSRGSRESPWPVERIPSNP